MWTVMGSPVGDLRIRAWNGAILAIDFAPFQALRDGRPLGTRADDEPVLADAVRQLTAYFAGDLTVFDLPLAPSGTDFQQRVWEQLRDRLRRDGVVRRGRAATWDDQRRVAGRGLGQWPQPDPHRGALSSGDRCGWHVDWLRRGARAQAVAAGVEQHALF